LLQCASVLRDIYAAYTDNLAVWGRAPLDRDRPLWCMPRDHFDTGTELLSELTENSDC